MYGPIDYFISFYILTSAEAKCTSHNIQTKKFGVDEFDARKDEG